MFVCFIVAEVEPQCALAVLELGPGRLLLQGPEFAPLVLVVTQVETGAPLDSNQVKLVPDC